MASTYSSNLRLELIGTGEQQGTWGSTTNTNLGTLLEQAIGGYESITVSNVLDTTLTTANGSVDQARNMTLNLTGTITATRNVICPNAEKIYIVKNSTTGGFAVTFKVTGQTGVSIPNGATYVIFVDGTDARQATGSVLSGGTGTTTSTGTGSVVLSASPTFTGVPLSTTAAVDTNTTQIATTAYVVAQASSTTPVVDGTAAVGTSLRYARGDHVHPTDTSRAALASPTFTGTPAAPTAAVDTNTTQLATTAYVVGQGYAKLASPSLTGTPLSTTAAANTSTTQIATTAFVIGQANGTAGTITMNGTQAAGTSALYARADHVHPSDTSRAPLASPSLTGTPLSTTAAVDTNTTQIATTAFVVGQGYAKLASPSLTGTPTAPTASGGTNTTQISTTAFVQSAVASAIPSGSVSAYAGSSAPSGWLLCSGAAVSRATYAALFAVVGTTYGAGDGSTTFNLPDLRGRAVSGVDNMGGTAANRITAAGSGITGTTLGAAGGAETHTLATAETPAHQHLMAAAITVGSSPALSASNYVARTRDVGTDSPNYILTGTTTEPTLGLTSAVGGGGAHNNTPPTMMLNYIIKT